MKRKAEDNEPESEDIVDIERKMLSSLDFNIESNKNIF